MGQFLLKTVVHKNKHNLYSKTQTNTAQDPCTVIIDHSGYALFKKPTADGIKDNLYSFVLPLGRVNLNPDGSIWNSLCKGCWESTTVAFAFEMAFNLYKCSRSLRETPVILQHCWLPTIFPQFALVFKTETAKPATQGKSKNRLNKSRIQHFQLCVLYIQTLQLP